MTETEARGKACRNVPLIPIQGVAGVQMVSPNCLATDCALWVSGGSAGGVGFGNCGLTQAGAHNGNAGRLTIIPDGRQ